MRSLLVLALTTLFLLPSCNFIKDKAWFGSGKKAAALESQHRQDSLRVADSLKQVKAEELAFAREQAIQDSLRLIEEEQFAWENRFRYHIIVGSFHTPEFAMEWSDYFNSMGFQTQIFEDVDGFDLVSALDLEDFGEAVYMMENYRDTVVIDAWIYTWPE